MTKREARKILSARKRIVEILCELETTLGERELATFKTYWGERIRGAISGVGYGSAPIQRAEALLGDPQ